MVKKSKPFMGTRLVTSIENIEGCYKIQGEWDKDLGVCWKEKMDLEGFTHPYKGVVFSYDVKESEDYENYFEGDYAIALAKTNDIISSGGTAGRFDTVMEAHDDVISYLESKIRSNLCCFDIRGKLKNCDEPGAIFGVHVALGDEIAKSYSKYFKEKKLVDIEPLSLEKRRQRLIRQLSKGRSSSKKTHQVGLI